MSDLTDLEKFRVAVCRFLDADEDAHRWLTQMVRKWAYQEFAPYRKRKASADYEPGQGGFPMPLQQGQPLTTPGACAVAAWAFNLRCGPREPIRPFGEEPPASEHIGTRANLWWMLVSPQTDYEPGDVPNDFAGFSSVDFELILQRIRDGFEANLAQQVGDSGHSTADGPVGIDTATLDPVETGESESGASGDGFSTAASGESRDSGIEPADEANLRGVKEHDRPKVISADTDSHEKPSVTSPSNDSCVFHESGDGCIIHDGSSGIDGKYTLQRLLDGWHIHFGNESRDVDNLDGFAIIAGLVTSVGNWIPSVRLCGIESDPIYRADSHSPQQRWDDRTQKAVGEQIGNLEEKIERLGGECAEAKSEGDEVALRDSVDAFEKARRELSDLQKRRREAIGSTGKSRELNSPAEKPHEQVRGSLRRAYEHLRKKGLSLAAVHFKDAIDPDGKGTAYGYFPRDETKWNVVLEPQ